MKAICRLFGHRRRSVGVVTSHGDRIEWETCGRCGLIGLEVQ